MREPRRDPCVRGAGAGVRGTKGQAAMTEPFVPAAFERRFEILRDGFATPHAITGWPGRISGCIYRADGAKAPLSERFGGHLGDAMATDNPDRVARPEGLRRLPGRGLYLGHFMASHYGHFITETLSTFWIFEEIAAGSIDYVLFHPFVFGEAMPGYARYCLERFGMDPGSVVLVGDEPLGFDELILPERLLRLNHSADPSLRRVYAALSGAGRDPAPPDRRLYLSRRRLGAHNLERLVANEVRIEALFARAGFETVYPETLPFPAQMALYARAAAIAGLSGSNLHNALFTPEGTLVVELGDPRYAGAPAPTQGLCNAVAGARGRFIPFAGRMFGPRQTMVFDLDHLARRLGEILGAAAPEGAREAALPGLPPPRPRELLEIGYRCARPVVGHLARRILPRRAAG